MGDGRWLAIGADDLYLVDTADLTALSARRVTAGTVTDLRWDPTGTRLALSDGTVVHFQGATVSTPIATGVGGEIEWAHDGTVLYGMVGGLEMVTPDQVAPIPVVLAPSRVVEFHVSPTRHQVAWVESSFDRDVVRMATTAGGVAGAVVELATFLTANDGFTSLAWSHDGDWIAIGSRTTGVRILGHAATYPGEARAAFTSDGTRCTVHGFSADGQHLLVTQGYAPTVRAYWVPFATPTADPAPFTATASEASISPRGRWIAWSDATTSWMAPHTDVTSATSPGTAASPLAWPRDENTVTMSLPGSGGSFPGRLVNLVPQPSAGTSLGTIRSVRYSRDGVRFASLATSPAGLYSVDVQGFPAVPAVRVASSSVTAYGISRDGGLLSAAEPRNAFGTGGGNFVYRVSSSGVSAPLSISGVPIGTVVSMEWQP